MLWAVSMYQGGIFVNADQCNYQDYKKLGLRCPECGEEVYLKKGTEKVPHFAHYKKSIDVQCSQRIEHDHQVNWRSLTREGKAQRKELFKLHFLRIIQQTFKKFKLTKSNISPEQDRIYLAICEKFRSIKDQLIAEIKADINTDWQRELVLKKLITREAIDYLSLIQSQDILVLIVIYIIENNQSNLLEDESYNSVCFAIKDLLLQVDWQVGFSKFNLIVVDNFNRQTLDKLNLNSYDNVFNSNYAAGRYFYYQDEFELAIYYFTKVIKKTNTDYKFIMKYEWSYNKEKNEKYKSIVDSVFDYDMINSYILRANSYQHLKQYQESIDDNDKLIVLFHKLLKDFSSFYIEEKLIIQYIEKAKVNRIRLEKKKGSPLITLIITDLNLALKLSEKYLQKAIKENNNDINSIKALISDSYYELSLLYHQLENYPLAIQYCTRAIENYPQPTDSKTKLYNLSVFHFSKGIFYHDQDDILKAIEAYTHAIDIVQDFAKEKEYKFDISDYYYYRFDAYCEIKKYDQALEDINYLVENHSSLFRINNKVNPPIYKNMFEFRADLKQEMGLISEVKYDLLNALDQLRKAETIDNIQPDCERILKRLSELEEST